MRAKEAGEVASFVLLMLAISCGFIKTKAMTTEQQPERVPFKVDTEIIPPGVDLQFAGQRNKLIESWRRGEIPAEDTMMQLLKLYWVNQPILNDETRFYLIDMASEFPAEADMDLDTGDRIWNEAMRQYSR